MTTFAKDEFDSVPQDSRRQGVHRAVEEQPRAVLWPVIAVGVLALVIGLVSYFLLPRLGITTPSASSSSGVSGQENPQGAPSSGSPSPSVAASEPAPAPSQPAPEPSPSATVPVAPPVDKTTAVSVYNGTTTGGLAGRVAGLVQGGGWPLGVVGNWGGAPQQRSVIFYNTAAQKSNAEALGSLLGIPVVAESADLQVPLAVVLGPGYN